MAESKIERMLLAALDDDDDNISVWRCRRCGKQSKGRQCTLCLEWRRFRMERDQKIACGKKEDTSFKKGQSIDEIEDWLRAVEASASAMAVEEEAARIEPSYENALAIVLRETLPKKAEVVPFNKTEMSDADISDLFSARRQADADALRLWRHAAMRTHKVPPSLESLIALVKKVEKEAANAEALLGEYNHQPAGKTNQTRLSLRKPTVVTHVKNTSLETAIATAFRMRLNDAESRAQKMRTEASHYESLFAAKEIHDDPDQKAAEYAQKMQRFAEKAIVNFREQCQRDIRLAKEKVNASYVLFHPTDDAATASSSALRLSRAAVSRIPAREEAILQRQLLLDTLAARARKRLLEQVHEHLAFRSDLKGTY